MQGLGADDFGARLVGGRPVRSQETGNSMTPELIAIIGVGVAVLAAMVPFNLCLIRQIGGLREGMARLEGLFEGFTGRQPQTDPGQ